MLWLLVGAALALPPALLGASGPHWVGTLPPEADASLVAVVDPTTGVLVVEARERDGRTRTWDGTQWLLDGDELNSEEPARGHRMAGGSLVSADAAFGTKHQFTYDEQGRLNSIAWSNGARMAVRFDDSGRVQEINGPATRQISLNWANGLRTTDAFGLSTHVRTEDTGPVRKVSVTDVLGRTVISRYRRRDEGWVLTGWSDPRGLETRIGRYGGRMDVTAPAGRVYRMEVDDAGVVSSVTMPGGQKWRWERSEEGVLKRMFDPAGRVTRIERDGEGRILTVSPSGRVKRVQRNKKGEVVGVVSATGANTQLIRDDRGTVRSIVDAMGNQVFVERYPNGWPSSVLERNGTRWGVYLDALGLPDRIEDPQGRVIQLHRSSGGWLERIEDSVHGVVRLGRDAVGRLVAVESPSGAKTQFVRDAAGRVRTIKRADGQVIGIERNPVGEVISLNVSWPNVDGPFFDGGQWTIERTPDGFIRSLGESRWERDINGRVRKMTGVMGEMVFNRDPAGWVREIQSGDWGLNIDRDANGWPVRWSGTDGEIEVQRDGSGRIVRELGENERRVLRDPRGLPVRIVVTTVGEWRTQRDATGRTLTVRGPEGVALSVERDVVGRPKWFRFPDGSILRRKVDGGTTDDVLVGPGGEVSAAQAVKTDLDGRVVERTLADGTIWTHSHDQTGTLLKQEVDGGALWLWEPGQTLDPTGGMHLNDGAGRLMEAQLDPGIPAWGLATTMLSVMREPGGPITGLGGDAGVAPVRYDPLGRLEGFRPADSPGWSLTYDSRGRPAVVTHPDGTEDRWVWAPDADPQDGVSGLLATGADGSVPWVFAEGGMAVRRNGMETESIVSDGRGDPAFLLDGTGELVHMSHSPSGVPNQDTAGIQGAGERLQWFSGGPIQLGAVSLDPVSGQRVDGVLGWPWSVQGPRKASAVHPSDPGPWAPTGAWSNPLKLLETLGVLQPIEKGEWTRIGSVPKAFTGLPESVDGAGPPLGPDREALPMGSEDPITDWLIHSLMPGGEAPEANSLAAALIGAEVKLPWLPPGFEIPGLEYWRAQAAFSQE